MTEPSDPWQDRVALVTGASAGLGRATVLATAARGAHVIAMSSNAERLSAALDGLDPEIRARVITAPGDVGDPEAAERAVSTAVGRFGRLDVLANVAGVSMPRHLPLADTALGDWERMLGVNLTGMYLMCKAALPSLVASDRGYIVNVLSTVSHMVAPGATLYAATKTGALGLTQSLIEEYRGTPLRISSLSPGKMNSSVWDGMDEPPTVAERSEMMEPADVAEVLVWMIERPPHLHIPAIMVRPWQY